MLTPRLAIDLSGNTVRVLAGSPGGPMRAAEAPVPAASPATGVMRSGGALAPLIKHLVAQLEVKETRALIAASDSLASFRILSFPRETSEPKIDSFVRAQLPLDTERMGMQRQDVTANGSERTVYAVAFDRVRVQELAAAVRLAGLEPAVLELKSLCLARIAPAPACVVLDLTVDPAEVFLFDRSLPRLWHPIKAAAENGAEPAPALSGGLRVVLGFYKRLPGGGDYPDDAPVFVNSERKLPPGLGAAIQAKTGHPLYAMPPPARVAPHVSYASFLACLGLIMRRR